MKSLVILSLFVLLVSADSQKKEMKSKAEEKAPDLDAQPSRRAYSNVQSLGSTYGKTSSYGSPGLHGSSLTGPNLLSSSYGAPSPHSPSRPQLSSSPYGPSSSHHPSSPQLPSSPHAPSGLYGLSNGHSSYGPPSSHRPVSSYGPSHSYGPPPKDDYGLVHDYPSSGHGKLDPTADNHREPAGGYRKGVEHSSPYGYNGFNNRGPALPNSHTRPSSYGSSYGSGPAPVHDSYSKPASGYTSALNRPLNGYGEPSYPKPSSGEYSKPAGGYGSGYGGLSSGHVSSSGGYGGLSSGHGSSSAGYGGLSNGHGSSSGGYGSSSGGYSKPLNGDKYSSGFSKPLPPSGYSKPLPPSGYSKPLPPSGYSKPLPPSGYSRPSSGYDNVRQYGAYSAAPPSGHGSSSYSPKPYPAPVPKPYGGYAPSSSLNGYAPQPSPHRAYAPPSGSGYSSSSHNGPVPVPHVSYAPSPSSGYAPASGYDDGYGSKAPASYSSPGKSPNSYYAPEALGGYAAPPSPVSYAPKVQRYPIASQGSSGYGPDAYGKAYGTVTQKEYSKTVETYGSTGGQGGHAYGDGRRAALHADHGIYGSASYGRRYDIDEQPQVHSQDQAIYGGYGHVY